MKNKTSKKTLTKKFPEKPFSLIAVVVVFAVVSVAMLPLDPFAVPASTGQQVIIDKMRVSASSLPCCLCCCKCYRWSLP